MGQASTGRAGENPNAAFAIFAATLSETDVATLNISTDEMDEIVRLGDAVVLDARPRLEWAISHIPRAVNVAPKPGTSISLYVSDVAEIERIVGGDKHKPLVLYCNGPFCGKSKRLASELVAAGYANVRRYQLGAPVWRALGKVMVIEAEGVRYVLAGDRTAVFIDAREHAEFSVDSLAGARNIPRSLVLPGKDVGEVKAAKDDGRLPMSDHNTRIVVFGRDGDQARHVADAITREAFHNVAFFDGSYTEFIRATRD
jgi:rhodanese-related sulfurtransferase